MCVCMCMYVYIYAYMFCENSFFKTVTWCWSHSQKVKENCKICKNMNQLSILNNFQIFSNIHQLHEKFSTTTKTLCIEINTTQSVLLWEEKETCFAFFPFPPVAPFSSSSQTHTSNYSSSCHFSFLLCLYSFRILSAGFYWCLRECYHGGTEIKC